MSRRGRVWLVLLGVLIAALGITGSNQFTAAAQANYSDAVHSAMMRGVGNAASQGVTQYVLVVDRRSGEVLAYTDNAWNQVASESIVKLHLAAYWLHRTGGNPAGAPCDLWRMIVGSNDSAATACWRDDAMAAVSGYYGLTASHNNWSSPSYWGATPITAVDTAWLIYHALRDPLVGPWLEGAMESATTVADDGYWQGFGFNSVAGAGSKQGWGFDSYWVGPTAVHSVGFTDEIVAAVLQTGGYGTYEVMPGTATYTVEQIVAASSGPSVSGPIGDKWRAPGGVYGLGEPMAEQVCGLAAGGCYQQFAGGRIFWSPVTGAWGLWGPFTDKYRDLGDQNGVLGYPLSDVICGLSGGGCYQQFQSGRVFWTMHTGVWALREPFDAKYTSLGDHNGPLGYPLSDSVCEANGGCVQRFQAGDLYWHPLRRYELPQNGSVAPTPVLAPYGGTLMVLDPIRATYEGAGGAGGMLGYPVTPESCTDEACYQGFEAGWIVWDAETAALSILTERVRGLDEPSSPEPTGFGAPAPKQP